MEPAAASNGADQAAPQQGQPEGNPVQYQPQRQPAAVGVGRGEPTASPTLDREVYHEQPYENRRLPSSTGTTWTAPGGQSYADRLRREGVEGSLSPLSPFGRPQVSPVPGTAPGASPLPPMSRNEIFGNRVTLDSPVQISE